MKITETPLTVPAAATRVATGSGQTEQLEQKTDVQDKVSVPAPDQASLANVRTAVTSGRAARVQEIVNAVKSGQYYPSPQQIAQQLVNDAEVEARLRAMLAR
jgi:anti-sigma28 factor (negative regulator of flagellin synthesis)